MISFLPRIKTFGDLSVVATHSLFLSRRFQQKKHKSSSNRRGGAMNPPPLQTVRTSDPSDLSPFGPCCENEVRPLLRYAPPDPLFQTSKRKRPTSANATTQIQSGAARSAEKRCRFAACTTFAAAPRFPPADLRINKKKGRCHSLHRPFPFIKTVIESS